MFHLHIGLPLRIEEGERGIWLTSMEGESTLVEKGGVLAFPEKTVGNIETAIEEHRQERSKILRGREVRTLFDISVLGLAKE